MNIEDRGYQFADGIYEVVYLYDGRFIDEDRHLDRLDRSLRELRIELPMSRAALSRVFREIVRRNRISTGPALFASDPRRRAARPRVPEQAGRPAVVVTMRRVVSFPADVKAWTAAAITQPDERWARCDIKSTSLLPNVLARQAAKEQGAAEAILFAADGMVTEGAATSFWIVDRDCVLRTRQLDHMVLPGCTRGALISLLQADGIDFSELPFSLADLRDAREVFVTSASMLVKPVVRIDGEPVGDGAVGPVAAKLFAMMRRHVRVGRDNAAEN